MGMTDWQARQLDQAWTEGKYPSEPQGFDPCEPCAVCGVKSALYTRWPACRDCEHHVCPVHQAPGTLSEADVDSPETCLCTECAPPRPPRPAPVAGERLEELMTALRHEASILQFTGDHTPSPAGWAVGTFRAAQKKRADALRESDQAIRDLLALRHAHAEAVRLLKMATPKRTDHRAVDGDWVSCHYCRESWDSEDGHEAHRKDCVYVAARAFLSQEPS